MALTDAEAKPATGAPLALHETILSLAALASNPSAPTPKMPGVVVQSATRNHVSARVPVKTLAALTGATVYGSEIQSPTERGDIQPQGRRASRLLGLFRQVSVAYGSKSLPTLASAPASGMIADGAPPIPLVDATFQDPSPRADFHMGQVRAAYSLQAVTQGGETFAALIDDSLTAAMAALQATQVIAGDGISPNVRGIVNTPGIGTSEYQPTNRGTAGHVPGGRGRARSAEYGPESRPFGFSRLPCPGRRE